MNKASDEEIMFSVSQGNLNKMNILFNRYHIRIFNFLLKMTNDKELSQDITQEVFYKVIKYRTSYNNGKFSSWIYTIARNILYSYVSDKKVKSLRLEDVEYKIESDHQDSFEKKETQEQLQLALEKLNQTDRELVVMNRYQSIKYKEIAEIIGSSENAVKTRVHRAIHKLKDLYLKKI